MNELMKFNNKEQSENFKCKVTTPSGVIHCDKDNGTPITLHGFLPFFTQFIYSTGQFENLIDSCPLKYKSNNAPEVKDVLGTAMLSVLSGHTRYSHATSLYGDEVAADILGLNKIVSHDSIERGFDKLKSEEAEIWLKEAYWKMFEPLLKIPYILDIDPTVKTLYGHQENAEVGYNPQKPGRKSHCLHTYFIGSLRIVLDVVVLPGNQTAGKYSHARLWSLLKEMSQEMRPRLIRGDIGFGNEGTMTGCENLSQNYLFKLKQTKTIKTLIFSLETPGHQWVDAGEGWMGCETEIMLSGWSRRRRVVILRRKHSKKTTELKQLKEDNQLEFNLDIVAYNKEDFFEYQILVTNTDYDIRALAQLYRDRGDCENTFDELKNQWGWGGFNSNNIIRAQIMMRFIGLIYNWWNVFCRLAEPNRHIEGRTSRRLYQNTAGRLVKSARSKIFYISAIGSKAKEVLKKFVKISDFISLNVSTATQLSAEEKWAMVLREAFKKFTYIDRIKAVTNGSQYLLDL